MNCFDIRQYDYSTIFDCTNDEESLRKDFCTRRSYRRGKVYVSDKGVNSSVKGVYHKMGFLAGVETTEMIYKQI